MQSWLQRARIQSGLTVSECACALCQSENSYLYRENNPGMLTLDEVRALMILFNEESRDMVWSALRDLKP